MRRPRVRIYPPNRAQTTESVPEKLKTEVEAKARILMEDVLGPLFLGPVKDVDDAYLVSLSTKWDYPYFYFTSVFQSHGSNALRIAFDNPLARLEYLGKGKFALAYRRHSGHWHELFSGLTIDECLESIEHDPWFVP